MTVSWSSVQEQFRFTIECWDDRGTANHKRAINYGAALWKSLTERNVLTSRRPSDIDTKLWLMTAVRLWRDTNIEPGLTHSVDDWWGVREWLDFHPEQMVEFEDGPWDVKHEMELRMLDAWTALGGEYGLEKIIQPWATEESSLAWSNLVSDLKDRSRLEQGQAVIQQPRIRRVNFRLIERLRKEPKAVFRISSHRFEELIAELLEGFGFKVKLTPANGERGPGDYGRDILAWSEDERGPYLLIVQAKNYHELHPVGVSVVRGFLGAIDDEEARSHGQLTRVRGMLVTSSRFTEQAVQFQQRHEARLSLHDFDDVVAWIARHPFTPRVRT